MELEEITEKSQLYNLKVFHCKVNVSESGTECEEYKTTTIQPSSLCVLLLLLLNQHINGHQASDTQIHFIFANELNLFFCLSVQFLVNDKYIRSLRVKK